MESQKKYNWIKIAATTAELSFNANNIAEIEVMDKKLCISLHQDTLYACTHKCPHAGGPLVDGYIDVAGNIVCPLHRYKFSLKNGRNTSGEGYFLKTFPLEVRNEGVFVGIEERSLFNWLK